jgi:hypothetical protein
MSTSISTRKSIRLARAAAAVVAVFAATASVGLAGGGGHSGGGNGGFGGNSASHLSGQGIRNSNGPNSLDRDKGLARAHDRMSKQGLARSTATHHHHKHKRHHEIAQR